MKTGRMVARLVTLFIIGIAAFGISDRAAAAEQLQTLQPGVLRIGTYFVNPPFEYIADGKRVGFEIDLLDEIALRLHLRPVYVNTEWETILQQMQNGRYDCIIGGITITPAREQMLTWSRPYLTTTLALIVNRAKTPQITGLADMKQATIGVQAATTDYDVAVAMQRRGEVGSIKVYPFAEIGEAMKDLAAGHITAVMKVYPVAAWLARQDPSLHIVAQVPDDPQPLGFGFRKDNTALVDAINRVQVEIQRDGTYQRLAQKWGIP